VESSHFRSDREHLARPGNHEEIVVHDKSNRNASTPLNPIQRRAVAQTIVRG
jgi:hypothetical protein